MQRTVKLLPREEIEDMRWNGCVHFAINGLPYAYTWFLDNVAETWDGLVWGDYEAVMPLVHKQKGGQPMLYQPALAQQLGMFSLKPIDKRLMEQFIAAIPATYTLWDVNFNTLNPLWAEGLDSQEHHSYYINLQPVYGEQQDKYATTVVDALKQAEAQGIRVKTDLKPELVVAHFKATAGRELKLSEEVYHSMHRIIYRAQHYGAGSSYGVYNGDTLIAAAFILYSKVANILLIPAFAKDSLEHGAYALVDLFIRNGAGSMRILDAGPFQTEAVRKVFADYGAEQLQYNQIKKGKLPWYKKWR